MHDDSRVTVVFAKRPRPGEVKTRLCPPLAPEGAAELALAMLDDTVACCRSSPGFTTAIAGAPAKDLHWFAERYPYVSVLAQRGADLGERLANGFADLLPGRQSVVAIGADVPLFSDEPANDAHRRLQENAEVVLAPDGGGGYALVGLACAVPELFLEVEMSTSETFARTLALARAKGLRVEILPELRDIDRAVDLSWLVPVLDREAGSQLGGHFPVRTHAALVHLGWITQRS